MRCWKVPPPQNAGASEPFGRHGPEGKLCPWEGGRGSVAPSNKSYSKLSQETCPVSHQTSVPLQQGLPWTQTDIFSPFQSFNFAAASAFLSSIKRLKWMLFLKLWTCFRLTVNETAKGDSRWRWRQRPWQKDPLPIPLIVLSEASGSASSEVC